MNTNQVGQSMSRERNEHSVESEMEGIRKGYIYIYIYIKDTVVPVPHKPVQVPPAQKGAEAI